MRYCIIITILFLAAKITCAQTNPELKTMMGLINLDKTVSGDYESLLKTTNIEGSPYLLDDFTIGSVYTNTSDEFTDIPLRYNIYSDQIEFKTRDNSVFSMGTPEIIERVELGNYKMVYSPYEQGKKSKQGFFIVLEEGKSSLYAKPQIILNNPTKPSAYKDAEPAKFIKKPDEYYIRIEKNEARPVENKKDLVEIFPTHTQQIETFIKKHKIKTKKAETLKELVQYYNSL